MAKIMTFDEGGSLGGGTSSADCGLSRESLKRESDRFSGSGGVSREARGVGFEPAFRDSRTGAVYRACFADGRPAPMHVLDGLPDELVCQRDAEGHVLAAVTSLESGFTRGNCFYTRDEAAAVVSAG